MDSEYLLTSSLSTNFSACLWDYKTLNVQKQYKSGGAIPPKCLECLGQDYILAAEIGKPLLHIWPLNSQDVAKNVRMILPEPATCLAVCPHYIYLAIGINLKLYIWHLPSGKLLSVQQKHYQPITCIKYSNNGEFILVGGQDGVLVAYQMADLIGFSKHFLAQSDLGQVEPIYVKRDHSMAIRDIHTGQFGSKSRFATVSNDQTCKFYNLLNGVELLTLVFKEILTAVIFDPPCWQLFIGTNSGTINGFYLKNPPRVLHYHAEENSITNFIGHNKKVVSLALNMTNSILVSGSDDNFVITWDIKSRQILKKIEHKNSITNVKFILNYPQFSADNFKPTIILKSLERYVDDKSDLVISQVQSEDIELSDEDEMDLTTKTEATRDVREENRKLRVINKQLYLSALEITKKYNQNKS